MDTHLLLEYLDARRSPVSTAGAALHRGLCEASPDQYLALLVDPAAAISHRREVLANLLRVPAARVVSRARIRETLAGLPAPHLLQVLDILAARRINSRRARTLLIELILGHEELALLAATHRQRLVRLLKHALGERTWSAVGRHLASPTPAGDALLERKLLRYARDAAMAREALGFVAGVAIGPRDPLLAKSRAARANIEEGAGLPRETLFGLRGIYHRDVPASRIRVLAAIMESTARRDGPLTALYKGALLESETRDRLTAPGALGGHLQAAVGALPTIDAQVAIVLDLSGSAASSGERAYHPAALGLALARILESRVRRVSLHLVGGSVTSDGAREALDGGGLPLPQGATDLARAMLAAARETPRVLLVITDGYENLRPGDAAQVAEGLRRLGQETVVYQVVPLFAAGEDLTQRRLGAPIQTIAVTHEGDVRELLARILLTTRGQLLPQEETALVHELVVAR